MIEAYRIVGPARGEPRLAHHVGARVRVPLSASPDPRWSRVLTAQLAAALLGHPAVGHLQLGHVVQGADIVLDGVEEQEAALLGPVLKCAVDAANRACSVSERAEAVQPHNMEPLAAQKIARALEL